MPNVQAARVSAFEEEAFSFDDDLSGEAAPSPAGSSGPEAHAISVETTFRGVGMGARILPFPREARRYDWGVSMLLAGGALLVTALVVFAVVAFDVAAEREAFATWNAQGKNGAAFAWKTRSHAGDAIFIAGLLSGGALLATGFSRRRSRRDGTRPSFLVGSASEVDAPVDSRFVSAPAHALVTAAGDDWVVHPTPQMQGGVSVAGQILSLAELTRGELSGGAAASFRLPPGARARLVCGATTFQLASIRRPPRIARPFFRWNHDEHVYTVGAALALGLFLVVIFSVPPDPRSLSLDLFGSENHLISFQIKPPVESNETPAWLTKSGPSPAGGAGTRSAGTAGTVGKKTSPNHDRAFATKGRDPHSEPRLAKLEAADQAREAGVLGVFKRLDNGPVAAIFNRESVFGSDAQDVLGNLVGTQIGEAAGAGGLSSLGTGSGGGGTGEHTLGSGHLETIGRWGGAGGGNRPGYGRGLGGLVAHHTTTPDVLVASASVRGALDKEIVRRIIRRHINEVKFCYEEELVKKPALSGRLLVQFMISGTGQVISSVLQSSTMGNAKVESCTVQAVRRWSFPQPQGGGMVTVSYPFVLAPAG
jgi:TonB family protein